MEEDIKILEEIIEYCKEHLPPYYKDEDLQAIENLIKGYRELEEEKKELQKYIKDYLIPKSTINLIYIPKSKIKEKMEELETKLKVFEKDIRYCKDRVQARLMNDEIYVIRRCRDLLQELMEDK